MKDNRIYRPEQLTEAEKETLAKGLDNYMEKMKQHDEENEKAREENRRRKIESGEWIEVDGKVYDARYYKGGKA